MNYLFAFAFGAVVGSFLNVCIYRIPREMSIISPASFCPSCGSRVRAFDNIPIVSFILLRGKCRDCRGRISLRYPLVETLNGALYCIVLWRFGVEPYSVVYMLLFSALIVITFIDLEFQIIPDVIDIPGAIVGMILGAFLLPDPFMRNLTLGFQNSLLGLMVGFGLFYLIALLSRGGMGGGDVKMMAMVGAFTGYKGVLLTTFVGSLVGSLIGIALMVLKGKGRKAKIPFGPFLAFGCIITILFGQEILQAYLP